MKICVARLCHSSAFEIDSLMSFQRFTLVLCFKQPHVAIKDNTMLQLINTSIKCVAACMYKDVLRCEADATRALRRPHCVAKLYFAVQSCTAPRALPNQSTDRCWTISQCCSILRGAIDVLAIKACVGKDPIADGDNSHNVRAY